MTVKNGGKVDFNNPIVEGSMMERAARDPELMRKINKNMRIQRERNEQFDAWARRGFIVWESD